MASINRRFFFREDNVLNNMASIFVCPSLFYFFGAMLRIMHELSLFWPLNGVMAGVFARYIWLNQPRYDCICYVAMVVYDAVTTHWESLRWR